MLIIGIHEKYRKKSLVGGVNAGAKRQKKAKFRQPGELEDLRQDLKDLNLLPEKKKEKSLLQMIFLFPSAVIKSIIAARGVTSPKSIANRLFSNIINVYPEYFKPLTDAIENSDLKVIPQTYVGIMAAVSFFASSAVFGIVLIGSIRLNISWYLSLLGLVVAPVAFFFLVFLCFYIYPFQRLSRKKKSIETNMPFAINHMAAIASSGVPPEKAFEMLVEFGDYGGITEESRNIVRRIKVLGEDITTALHHVAERTPSEDFKELLYGIVAIIESGGNLKDYLNEMAEIALFNYQLSRKKYLETLSTYADIYTVILIAAPMFLVSILTVMNIVPDSNVGSMSITAFIALGVYVLIPLTNIGFLAFVTYTQPES